MATSQRPSLNRVKASAFRRWPVTLGLIALVQTTRWTGGHDFKDLDGDRFEYEMNMLIEASRLAYRIKEVDIKTHYVRDNSESHFRVFVDSFKIYRLIFRKFFAKFFN